MPSPTKTIDENVADPQRSQLQSDTDIIRKYNYN